MAALTVWKFETDHDADQAAETLLEVRAADPSLTLDAAVVRWEQGSLRPETCDAFHFGRDSGLGPTFWGLLFGLIFFMPLLGAAVGSAPTPLTGWLADAGITDHFVNRVRDEVVPGTSALFVVAPRDVLAKAEDSFYEQYRPELLVASLNSEQEQALQQVFGVNQHP